MVVTAQRIEDGATGSRRQRARLQAPSITTVAAFAVLAAITLLALHPAFDADFWWHLKDGQYIVNHHSVPTRDFMSYVFSGHPWTDHEWLPEITMYGLYKIAGLQGPVVFYGLVIGSTFTLVYLNMVQRGIRRVLALALLLPSALASAASWGPRVQMLTLLFLSIYALVLLRFEATRDRRLLAVFPPVMVVWANSHGGFVLGLALMLIVLVGEYLNHRTRHERTFSLADLRLLGSTFAVTFAVTLINPNGVRQLLYPLTFLTPNPFTNSIAESASPNFHLLVFFVFGCMLLALVTVLYLGRYTMSWTHLLMILAMTYLALDQTRNVPVWCVLISPLLALYIQQTMGSEYVEKRLAGGVKSVINVAFVLVVVAACAKVATTEVSSSTVARLVDRSFPTKAVSYMSAHQLPSHVFVEYSWAGYLLWKGFPRYKVYMDSRADTVYTVSILEGYNTMFQAAPDWQEKLAEYRVDDVLIPRQAPLAQVLAQDSAWRLAYRDSQGVIYVRVAHSS
jgi:hypothetical protein